MTDREKIAKFLSEQYHPHEDFNSLPKGVKADLFYFAEEIIKLLRPAPELELISDEEIQKAWDNAFEVGTYFDHKPTEGEIHKIYLRAIAQAQLAADQKKMEG